MDQVTSTTLTVNGFVYHTVFTGFASVIIEPFEITQYEGKEFQEFIGNALCNAMPSLDLKVVVAFYQSNPEI